MSAVALSRPHVALWIASWRATAWTQTLLCAARESALSRHLAAVEVAEHVPMGLVRQRMMASIETGTDDLVVMSDDDLAIDVCLGGVVDRGLSVIDHVVRQWQRAEPHRVLYAPARWESARTGVRALNEERAPGGEVLHGGAAFMAIPRAVWSRVRAAGRGWTDRADDVQFCADVRELGMRVEPNASIRVRHRSEWVRPLECVVDAEGRATPVEGS